ncbi:hypothetical protein ACPOL_2227 [Acidisarcina polymorpha]|uniref:Uncharacterized protein n=1 Tax=Acidisarcina polymorpha TaxID=2211140 RepID=A0A2Z5FXG8_9BACT|nr:hypothetical protein ACPOL_2227 [Acidisarcina polymorpha]
MPKQPNSRGGCDSERKHLWLRNSTKQEPSAHESDKQTRT